MGPFFILLSTLMIVFTTKSGSSYQIDQDRKQFLSPIGTWHPYEDLIGPTVGKRCIIQQSLAFHDVVTTSEVISVREALVPRATTSPNRRFQKIRLKDFRRPSKASSKTSSVPPFPSITDRRYQVFDLVLGVWVDNRAVAQQAQEEELARVRKFLEPVYISVRYGSQEWDKMRDRDKSLNAREAWEELHKYGKEQFEDPHTKPEPYGN